MQGLITEGIQEIHLSQDNETIRLILKQGEKDFYIDLPAENVDAMLALLIKTSETAKAPGYVRAITVTSADVVLDEAGDVLLTLENTAGLKTTYSLSLNLVVQLSALLETAQIVRGGSSARH